MLSTLLQCCIVIVTQIKLPVLDVVAIRLLDNSHILGSKDLRPASGLTG